MARVCEITGKKPAVGNNVSHSNRRTKRRFLPNLQEKSLMSEILGQTFKLRLSTKAIRTIDKHNGLDNFMLESKERHTEGFSGAALKLRKLIRKKAKEVASA